MGKVNITLFLLFLMLLIGLLYINKCSSTISYPEKEVITDTFYLPGDTVVKTVKRHVPKYDTVIITDTVFAEVDTFEILKAFFAQAIYNDSADFKNVRVYINDTISRNKIIGREISFKELHGAMVIVKEKPAPKQSNLKLYIGGGGAYYDYRGSKYAGLGPASVLTTKRNAIGYSYDVFNNGHQVNVFWLISFKNHKNK